MIEWLPPWHGLFLLPVWGYVLVTLALTHITIVSVTLYLHRDQAHRGLQLSAPVRHFFRFWLWLTTGMVTRAWVAIHRKHHALCETCDDPHSPTVLGLRTVLWSGAELYRREAENNETLRRYGHGTPDDFLERHLYARYSGTGILSLLAIHVVLFGLPGLTVWAIQMLWIPFFAAGVINGVGHWFGYRSFSTPDASTNISRLGILIGGEELHNNHHAYPYSARFSLKHSEFDLGWGYIRVLKFLRLAKVLRQAPRLKLQPHKTQLDLDTVRALIRSRITVMSHYAHLVVLPAMRQEARRASRNSRQWLKKLRKRLLTREHQLTEQDHSQLQFLLDLHPHLKEVLLFRQRLQQIFRARNEGLRVMHQRLDRWCAEAEQTGIDVLQEFSRRLCRYSLQPT